MCNLVMTYIRFYNPTLSNCGLPLVMNNFYICVYKKLIPTDEQPCFFRIK
jgi:hypothetical protein